MRKEEKNREQEHRIGIKGWGSLFLLIILFSGIFTNSGNFLKAFDLSNLIGSFGIIADGLNFEGQGGVGAREGFMFQTFDGNSRNQRDCFRSVLHQF